MEKLEFISYWWLPNNPNCQVAGNLVYIPNKGATLTLMGSFREEKDYFKLLGKFRLR